MVPHYSFTFFCSGHNFHYVWSSLYSIPYPLLRALLLPVFVQNSVIRTHTLTFSSLVAKAKFLLIWHNWCLDYYCSVWYSEVFLFNIAAFISFPSLCFCVKCGGRTGVSHLFPFSWKIVPTLTLLSSLILWKLLKALLTHTFCAYCGQTSPNSDDISFWAIGFFLCRQDSFLRITQASTSFNIFCHLTCFWSVQRRFKLHYLFQHEKQSITFVLLSLGSSLTLYILVPRR